MDTNSDKKTGQKPIEMKPVNSAALLTANENNAENSEEDVIIGRFRKISSAKSMAITNGNSKYPEDNLADIPAKPENDDVEQGLLFKNIENNENYNFNDANSKAKVVPAANRSKVTKSSFRDTEKPSRFRDNPSITRFQMAELARNKERQGAETEEEEEAGEDSDDPLTAGNDTKYGKSFRHFTREALPRLDNYRNVLSLHAAPRPTLDELHNASLSRKPGGQTLEKDGHFGDEPTGASLKFGWLQGVLMRCLLNIWGVMLFLRLTWVVAQAGVVQSVVLILTTTIVTTITALSMSAISTNGVIKGGGTYYMISRSLGPEFGGSIGLIFSVANAVACAMYVVGFSESLRDLMASFGSTIVDGGATDLSITGSVTIVVLTVIVVVGMEWEAKAQIGLLVILLVAIADFLIGTIVGPKSDLEVVKGFLGYNNTLMYENLGSDYRPANGVNHDFFSVFSVFFPAATGILAGANISGDLKDPQKSIPKGTLLAIVLTTISYVFIAILAGWSVARDASGNVTELVNGTFLDCSNRTCQYGLHNSFQVIELVSGFGPLIYAGCFAATLSSALASLVSAPKVFQALCKDKLYPGIYWFAKGYGKNNEPVRGYILTFFIAIGFILIGDLNTIAPLISNFFLAAYMLINFSTFHASLAKPVGWRPTFRYYNMWLSLFGAIICVAVMFLISWATALLTFAVVLALYLIVSYRKPDVNWGSTTQAQTYKNALTGVHQLNRVTDHVKNYRPQILVLTSFPAVRPALTDFTYLLTKGLSLMVCGHIVEGQVNNKTRNALNNRAYQWFTKQKVKAFYVLVDDAKLQSGASALVQATGLGKLKPNILLMGYKTDWNTCPNEELVQYVEVMHKALDVHMALAILRVDGGLDCSSALDESLQTCLAELQGSIKDTSAFSKLGNSTYRESSESLGRSGVIHASQASSLSDISMASNTVNHSAAPVSEDPGANEQATNNIGVKSSDKDPKSVVAAAVSAVVGAVTGAVGHGARRASSIVSGVPLNQFTKKQSGHIDVWWLYDDGGLTLLLPYIISTRRNWASCRLRVFTLANKKAEMEFEERSMASLLSKFRIDYSDLKMIPDITKKPQESTITYFNQLIAKFLVPENPSDPDSAHITEADLLAAQDRTYRHLRLRELIATHSSGARLVCVTLPMPRRRLVTPPHLYLAWLEALSGGKGMPPVLLVRGNQTSVLTFYS